MSIRIRKFIGRPIPGDHHFTIKDGPTLTAETADEVIAKIAQYRINNGIPQGNPRAELTEFYAKEYPFAVENGEPEDDAEHDAFFEEVIAWINRQWKNPPKQLLPIEDTHRRQECCQDCPLRVKGVSDHGPAEIEARRRLFLLAKGAPLEDDLGACTFHKWDNRLALLIPLPEIIQQSPKYCWCFHSPAKDLLDKSK